MTSSRTSLLVEDIGVDRRLLGVVRLVFNGLDSVWQAFNPVRFDVLLHVVALDESPCAMWALVRFVPAVNLPVPVQAARVGELLSTNLAGNCRLPIGANLTGFDPSDRVFL